MPHCCLMTLEQGTEVLALEAGQLKPVRPAWLGAASLLLPRSGTEPSSLICLYQAACEFPWCGPWASAR